MLNQTEYFFKIMTMHKEEILNHNALYDIIDWLKKNDCKDIIFTNDELFTFSQEINIYDFSLLSVNIDYPRPRDNKFHQDTIITFTDHSSLELVDSVYNGVILSALGIKRTNNNGTDFIVLQKKVMHDKQGTA